MKSILLSGAVAIVFFSFPLHFNGPCLGAESREPLMGLAGVREITEERLTRGKDGREGEGFMPSKTLSFDRRGRLIREVDYDEEGAVFESKEMVFLDDGRLGKMLSSGGENQDARRAESYAYDFEGRLVSVKVEIDGILAETRVFTYSGEGLPLSVLSFGEDGLLSKRESLSADSEGRIRGRIMYDKEGNRLGSEEYEYDSSGRRTREKVLEAEGKVVSWSEFVYGREGQTLRLTRFDPDGLITSIVDFVYDAGTRLRERTEVSYSSDLEDSRSIFRYAIDSKGNWIELAEFDATKGDDYLSPLSVIRRRIEYFMGTSNNSFSRGPLRH
jgi:hypothetical protein